MNVRAAMNLGGMLSVLAVATVTPSATLAQGVALPSASPTVEGVAPSWRTVGISALAVAASFPLDGHVRAWMQADARQNNATLRHATDILTPLGSTVPIAAGAALYVFARAFHHPVLQDEMWHSGQAVLAASAVTQLIKVVTHRPRPYVPPHDPGVFFQGPVLSIEGARVSFPSGHTTLAFAVAGAANEELRLHPFSHSRSLGVALYAVASGVAFSRVYDDRHWTSDVVAGAVVGTLVSRSFIRWAHRGDGGSEGASATGLGVVPGPVPMVEVRWVFGH